MTKLLPPPRASEPAVPAVVKWSAICGAPKTGKTTLAHELANKLGRGVISSDFFLKFDRDIRPSALARFIKGCSGKGVVVEGCEVTRLLPRLKELDLPPPDRLVFLGSTFPEDHDPKYRSLLKMQLRQIHEAQAAGILKPLASAEPGPRVIYLPRINPKQFLDGLDD